MRDGLWVVACVQVQYPALWISVRLDPFLGCARPTVPSLFFDDCDMRKIELSLSVIQRSLVTFAIALSFVRSSRSFLGRLRLVGGAADKCNSNSVNRLTAWIRWVPWVDLLLGRLVSGSGRGRSLVER